VWSRSAGVDSLRVIRLLTGWRALLQKVKEAAKVDGAIAVLLEITSDATSWLSAERADSRRSSVRRESVARLRRFALKPEPHNARVYERLYATVRKLYRRIRDVTLELRVDTETT
jgi:hypothetical protein